MFRSLAVVGALLLLAGCIDFADGERPGPDSIWRFTCIEGPQWSDPCTSAATLVSGPANENFLAVNPTDPLNVVIGAKNYDPRGSDCVWAGVSATHDGGKTWENTFVGGDKENRAESLAMFQCVTDPMLAFAPDGTLYYVVEAYGRVPRVAAGTELPRPLGPTAGGSGLFLAVSHDGGNTFPFDEIRPIISRPDAIVAAYCSGATGSTCPVSSEHEGLDDRTCLIVAPETGTLYMGWSTQGTNQGLFAVSRDQGGSWTTPLLLNEGEPGFPFPVCPTRAPDGTLYIVWRDGTDGGIRFLASRDDGVSFSPPRTLFTMPTIGYLDGTEFNVISQPFLAVDRSQGPQHGRLYLAFPQAAAAGYDILLTSSDDGGETWAEPWPVAPPDASDQFHSTLLVDDEGTVHVTYYDRAHDPDNRLIDLTWAQSRDGHNFTYERVTASSFDGDLGNHQEGTAFLGDYNGLAQAGDVIYASFADNRMGRSDVALAHFIRS